MGEKTSGVEQTVKDKTENVKGQRAGRRENRSSNEGERTIDKSRLDSETKKEAENRSWNVCEFATEERKRLEIVEQVTKRDLDIV